MKKNILVTGSSGFIGGHLVKQLKAEGHQVFGMDILPPAYTAPSEFIRCDLRSEQDVESYFGDCGVHFDEVYNLACLMGGMGFIGNPENDYDVMIGSTQIVVNLLEMGRKFKMGKSFFSSSACVYNENRQKEDARALQETDAYPAMPDLVYGWQKLFSEQMYHAAMKHGMDVRIARFHNIFGPQGAYEGGKEKAPAALCRKVAEASEGGYIEVWGDGKQLRSFLYISECLEGVERLMRSQFPGPLNIGSDAPISINDLARLIIEISGKKLTIRNVDGPQGVRKRNSNNWLIREMIGWTPSMPIEEGIRKTYEWIEGEISKKQTYGPELLAHSAGDLETNQSHALPDWPAVSRSDAVGRLRLAQRLCG